MRNITNTLLVVLFFSCGSQSPQNDYYQKIKNHRQELNKKFIGSESPLLPEDKKNFLSLQFFPIDSNYAIWAELKRTPNAKPFIMQTSTDRKVTYNTFGYALFNLHGTQQKLGIYYQVDAQRLQLFLPFSDATSGFETYGGGRYLDIDTITENKVLIDFNLAYNPYCAYNYKYSCPIPPKENHMDIKIEAGEMNFH